jgi:tetratricopeptide (TPR) repeat protein
MYFLDRFLTRRSLRFALLTAASYLLALFSKEAAIFFLPLFLLHELLRRKRFTFSIHALYSMVTVLYWAVKSTVIGRGGIPIRFFPGLLENGRVLLGVLGYYLRTLVYPFQYDMFLPVDRVQTVACQVAGAGFLFLLAFMLWLGRKKIQFIQAWIWIVPFLAGHLLMVFTPIYPFSISSRYLLLPAIGLTWLLAHGLRSLPKPARTIVLAMLLFAQAAAIIGNSHKYRSERAFWASAIAACPQDSFFLNQYAGQLRREGDFVRAEILLRRALASPMQNSTAAAIALQLADLTRSQARYEESLGWLEKMRSLALDLPQRTLRLSLLRQIHQARGEMALAEKAIQAMASVAPAAQVQRMRVELYLAFAAWEEARSAARSLPAPEAGAWRARIDESQGTFLSMPPRAQAVYFFRRGCFMCAWQAWPKPSTPGFAEELELARLAFFSGQEAEGNRRVEILARAGKNDFRMLNSIGNLFFELQRAADALPFYRLSLRLNARQPSLRQRLGQLEAKADE